MKELKFLGSKKTGKIDKRRLTESSANFSIFECPVCKREFELQTSIGSRQKTCRQCKSPTNLKHNMHHTRQYHIWAGMKNRCNSPRNTMYHIYGGKGIKVDPKWESFEGFWEDMGSTYEDGLTIDRIDSGKDYCKSNCRWITASQNSEESSRRVFVNQYKRLEDEKDVWVFEKTWTSIRKAALALGLDHSAISKVCSGKSKTCGGFRWEYVNEVTNGDLNV